jgi:hypothetical protein
MADHKWPDFSPAALSRLVAGLTPDEVEAIVGPVECPHVYEGLEHLAWIGVGGMLRAFFKGPGRTLSAAVLDVPEEQRRLDLGSDRRRRVRQATIVQTWYCVSCRRRYRQPLSGRDVTCAVCGGACEPPITSIRVPSPKHAKAWDKFWVQYRAEQELLDAYGRGELREAVRLELFDVTLPKCRPTRRRT